MVLYVYKYFVCEGLLLLIALSVHAKAPNIPRYVERETLWTGEGGGAACLAKACTVQYALKIIRKLEKMYGSKISLKKL